MPTYGYRCDTCDRYAEEVMTISAYRAAWPCIGSPESPQIPGGGFLSAGGCPGTMVRQFDAVNVIGDELRGQKILTTAGEKHVHGDYYDHQLGQHINSKSHLQQVLKAGGLVQCGDKEPPKATRKIQKTDLSKLDPAKVNKLALEIGERRVKRAQEMRALGDVGKPAQSGWVEQT